MIEAPPSDEGALKATDNWVSPAVMPDIVGAPGVEAGAAGVPVTAEDCVPFPTELTARILT